MSFERTFTVIWADMDPNVHMRHSAYNDYAAQTRLDFLAQNGFSMQKFAELAIGPILFREDTRFMKEIHLSETIHVTSELAGLNEDASRWRIVHIIRKSNGQVAASVTVDGAWLDLKRRKLTVPPADLAELMRAAPRHESYADIVRKPSE
ncbi:acyl-CoA thioesterase [Hymenobacter jejuensis]|uniref:acyl-CoA thioesterase n=1 Tax=Hymenobacter jejuensis TaxID=2502781 RepID=UPI001E5E6FF0|nr:thioesterase family protein [Hymenobacter jejuensis]